jgi:GTP 3',8-cyclase
MRLKLHGDKLVHHLDALAKWKNGEFFAPLFIEFGPVSGCNHRCMHCYVKRYIDKIELMPERLYLRFIKEIGAYGIKAIVLAGCGEPLMHKSTPRAVLAAKAHGIDVGMFTNGVFISDDNADALLGNLTFIRLTINGYSAGSYGKIHGTHEADFGRVMGNLRKLVDLKQRKKYPCTIGVYTILLSENIAELESGVKRLKRIGVDYVIVKPPEVSLDKVQLVQPVKAENFEPVLQRIKAMNSDSFTVEVRWDLFASGCVKSYGRCLGLPFMCTVDADGSVYACNWFWKKNAFKYGDLKKNTFPEIWEGQKKERIIKKVSSGKFDIRKCGLCRQNSINIFLWDLVNPPQHVNFI